MSLTKKKVIATTEVASLFPPYTLINKEIEKLYTDQNYPILSKEEIEVFLKNLSKLTDETHHNDIAKMIIEYYEHDSSSNKNKFVSSNSVHIPYGGKKKSIMSENSVEFNLNLFPAKLQRILFYYVNKKLDV